MQTSSVDWLYRMIMQQRGASVLSFSLKSYQNTKIQWCLNITGGVCTYQWCLYISVNKFNTSLTNT